MSHTQTALRFASLSLTAAAFPFAPLLAQEAQTETAAPVEITPPPAPAAPAQKTAPPVINAPPVAAEAPAAQPAPGAAPATQEAPPARQPAPARTVATPPRGPTPPPPTAAAIDQVVSVPSSTAPTVDAMPPPAPALELPPVALEPAPEVLPEDPAPTGENRQGSGNLPLLLIGLLVIAGIAAALFFARRRPERYIHQGHHAPHQPVTASVAEPAIEAPAAVAAAAPAAILGEAGRPRIELLLRPIRAGVSEDEARVEFELCVDNKGTSPAEDVRISSFLSAAGAADIPETGAAPEEAAGEACLPAPIEPGDGKRIASAVTLPRNGLGHSILPVVVARARYRLPDGSEGRTSASFAVGVAVGGELAHFDVENPSGFHEGVEARQQGEPLKV